VLVLLDNNVPHGIVRALKGHVVIEARARGWHTYKNGDLLDAAERAAFDVMITSDKNIRYQQSLQGRKIALVVLTQGRWQLVRQHLAAISVAVDNARPGTYTEVDIPIR
jgi:hypothetical protein